MKGGDVNSQRLSPRLTAIVVVTLLGMFAYNLVVYGPDGYPTSMILGGLLGGYIGVGELIKRRSNGES